MQEDLIRANLQASARLLQAVADQLSPGLARAAERAVACLRAGGKLAFCGNGGSATQAQHLAGELVGRFRRERPGLAALAFTADGPLLTALGNDYAFDDIFRRQVEALLRPGDLLVGLSTSGNSPNVVRAVELAREMGVYTVAFTGEGGGRLAELADLCLAVPHRVTSLIQEAHLALGHSLCELIETALAEERAGG